MTTIEKKGALPAEVLQSFTGWKEPKNTYVCRTTVRRTGDKYEAESIRLPSIKAEGDSPQEVYARITAAYRRALEANAATNLRPYKEVTYEELSSAMQLLVESDSPSVRDINRLFADEDLTTEEINDLESQRSSASARPTVPLTRFKRQ